MSREFEMLDMRIRRLESQNRRLKWLGITLAALAVTTTAWGQTGGNTVAQAQKFELRDEAGRLRGELAILNGRPGLRFFDTDGNVQSLLAQDSFSIFKKGGDNQAVFGKDGLEFGDGQDKTFIMLEAHERDQMGKLRINDYRQNVYGTVTAEDLAKLHPVKTR